MRFASIAMLFALVPSLAGALTISEPPDFGNSFAARTILPAGTDVIAGSVFTDGLTTFDNDWVAFTDLQPGASFTVTALDSFAAFSFPLQILNSANGLILNASLPKVVISPVVVATGVVPLDGQLVFRIVSSDFQSLYQLRLDAARVVPEPGAALLLALGLFALARRRR